MQDILIGFLVKELLSEATDPAIKRWIIAKLKEADNASTNKVMKVALEAVEAFLGAAA